MITVTPLSVQLWAVCWAAAAGMICGILYDIFREIRWTYLHKWLELLLDTVFSIVVSILIFTLVTSIAQLRLRGFLLLSMAVGWLLWNVTIGRLFRRLFEKIILLLGYILRFPINFCNYVASHLTFRQKQGRKSRVISKESGKK